MKSAFEKIINDKLDSKEKYEIISYICNNINFNVFSEDEKTKLLDTPLFEQAYSRDIFVFVVSELAAPIFQNLSLIIYTKTTKDLDLCKKLYQYKTTLKDLLLKIAKLELKNCPADKHRETLNYAFFEYFHYNIDENIFNLLSDKFKEEGIDVYKETHLIYDIIEEATSLLKRRIIPLLCLDYKEAKEEISKYISNILWLKLQ